MLELNYVETKSGNKAIAFKARDLVLEDTSGDENQEFLLWFDPVDNEMVLTVAMNRVKTKIGNIVLPNK